MPAAKWHGMHLRRAYRSQEGLASPDLAAASEQHKPSNLTPLAAKDARAVAKRVLEDLEDLFDQPEEENERGSSDSGDSNGSSGRDGDSQGLESDSEWDETSSNYSRVSTGAGITLEELTVAVNAAIECYRPATTTASSTLKADYDGEPATRPTRPSRGRRERYEDDHEQPRYEVSLHEPKTGASSIDYFRQMLESKERQFYAVRADVLTENEEEENEGDSEEEEQDLEMDREFRPTIDQQQQTTSCVRDQATETEVLPVDCTLHMSSPGTEKQATPSPLLSLALSVGKHEEIATECRIAEPTGPTLADLASAKRSSRGQLSLHQSPPSLRSSRCWSRSGSSLSQSDLASLASQSYASSGRSRDSTNSGDSKGNRSKSKGSHRSSRSKNKSSHSSNSDKHFNNRSRSDSKTEDLQSSADAGFDHPAPMATSAIVGDLREEQRVAASAPSVDTVADDTPLSLSLQLQPNAMDESPPLEWELDLSNFMP